MARSRKWYPKAEKRSKYEDTLWDFLQSVSGITAEYETEQLKYYAPVRKAQCQDCSSKKVLKTCSYTPDFIVTRPDGSKVYIEAKGYFKAQDRAKMHFVKKANPELDIRMVFMQNTKLKGEYRYSNWCEDKGFPYHVGYTIPLDWLLGGESEAPAPTKPKKRRKKV